MLERLVLPLIVFLPIALIAQTGLNGMKEPPGPAASRLEGSSFSAGSANSSSISSANGTSASSEAASEGNSLPQTNNSAKAQKTNKSKAQTPNKPSRPTNRGSMVGYVDDAIVGSQIRIRFDAGFHNNAPDRADFFYAQYAGLNGPGPNSVVTDLNFQQ